ncbi:transcriptional regulator CynR [Streptomyces sp. NPDC059740]|uniref:transcriptional regulator CynR n=1 Tax=Streptomyces sp. NPDC059740 TaxID=3346926 RepID=UPI00365BEF9A
MAPVELRHLRYLLAVAEHGSFTRAAEDLHVSQPTLSQQIRRLEKAVGLPLLERTARTVRPTDAGEVYLRHARRAVRELAAAHRAVQDVQDLSLGSLRLGVTPTFTAYLVGPLLGALHAHHPGLRLTVSEAPQDHLEETLLAGDLDVGIGFLGAHAPGIGAEPLFTETLALVTGADAPPSPDPVPVADLAGRDLALLGTEFATRTRIDTYFAGQDVRPRVTVEADSVLALAEIVRGGPLATVLPRAVAQDRPGLTALALDPPLPHRTAALLTRDGGYRSAAVRAFTALLHAHIGQRGLPPA